MRIMKKVALGLALASSLGFASATSAQNNSSGTFKGAQVQGGNTIVGVNSTATLAGGGDSRYLGQSGPYRGVVGLVMTAANGSESSCSGSLTNNGRSIVSAAHCVSGGAGTALPTSVKAFFYDGNPADVPVYTNVGFGRGIGIPGVTVVDVTDIFVHPLYSGQFVDQNDIAVLRLGSAAPLWAQSYDLFTGTDLTGIDFNVAGYGRRSDGGGNVGANLGTGRLRQGDNRYDFRMGDSDFGPQDWYGGFLGTAAREHVYLSDFDNGLIGNDQTCGVIGYFFGLGGPKYCDLGRGLSEVGIAPGDSGGGGFVNGQLATVNSFGLTFFGLGDIDNRYNSSFGEFSGYVPVYIHGQFLQSAFVPEPATWAMMIFGFGIVGSSVRRRASVKTAAA